MNLNEYLMTCTVDDKDCPCKIYAEDKMLCNFFNTFADLNFYKKNLEVKELLKKVCNAIRNKINFHEYLAKSSEDSARAFLRQVNKGDLVYCTTEMNDVVFLKKPRDYYGKCTYKTLDGIVKEQWSFCFCIISKGDKFFDFKVSNLNNAKSLSLLAREYGFRVKIIDNIIRIFGDTQEEVDSFAISYYVNKFVIY